MNITFGMFLDGYEPRVQESALGALVTGPRGLLDVLETRLGLGGVRPPEPVRVVQYQQCLQQADDGARFYSASLAVDPLAVAETLLGWRDEWIAAGWSGGAGSSDGKRLRDLAEVEALAVGRLGIGDADRLRAVILALETRDPGIQRVRVVDPVEQLPPAWRQLLGRLPAEQTDAEAFERVTAREGSDLAALQTAVLTNTRASLRGDGSFFALAADSEHSLALALGETLAARGAGEAGATTVIAEQRASVLDEGLRAADLPVSGRTDRSPWRPAQQVLRLALSLVWKPLDPRRLLEFLAHPVCPVSQPLRGRLARVLARAPGIGGADWNRVVEQARAAAVDAAAAGVVQEQVDTWLAISRFDPVRGAPPGVLAEHCGRIAHWAAARGRAPGIGDAQRQSFRGAQKQACSVAQAIDELAGAGVETLAKLQFDRLIDQVTARGTARPDAAAECGHAQLLAYAGAAIERAPRVVWWDFCAPGLPRRWPWSPSELGQLRAQGADLPCVSAQLQFAARAWLRPALAATEQLVLVMPRRRAGEPAAAHPLWNRIVALARGAPVPCVALDRMLDSGERHPWLLPRLSGVVHRPLPRPRRWWRLRDGNLLAGRGLESFSSLENFINAPHRWVLRYKARLEPGSLAAIPEDNRQKGALLHRLVEWLFTGEELDWRSADRGALRRWVDRRFPVLLHQEGANFLLPGKARELEELRATAVDAAWALLGHLRGAGAGSVRVEAPAEGRYRGGRLAGRIDLLVRGQAGGEAVVDLKWGGFKYRCKELRDNRQLQLTAYSVMRRQATGRWPDQAYFVLDEGRMAAQDNRYFGQADVCAPGVEYQDTAALWTAFEQAWAWRREQLDQGLIEVNVAGTTPDRDSEPPEGALAVAGANDRFDDYIALTGWPEEA